MSAIEPARRAPLAADPSASDAGDGAAVVRSPDRPGRGFRLFRSLGRLRRDVNRTAEVVRRVARFLVRSSLPRMAAALSYRTIFGLIPTLVIGVAVLGTFASEQAMQATVRQLLVFAGISEIVIDEREAREAEQVAGLAPAPFVQGPFFPIPASAGPPEAAAGEPPGQTSGVTPDPAAGPTAPRLEEWISLLVSRVRGIAFQAIGAIGVLMLIYAAISMLIEVERAFNDIYRAPTGRAWGRRIPLYWTVLTLGVIFILATFFVGARATAWLAGLTPALGPGTGLGALLTFVATVFTSTVLLLAVYLWVPNTRVALRPALAGALVAALLWESCKLGLTRYIEYSATYARLYGSLGLLPLLLLWIYVTWLIVLFGLQVAHALQHFNTWKAEDKARNDAPAIIEPAAILAVAAEIARGFAAGTPTPVADLGTRAGVDDRVAGMMTDRLVAAGVALIVHGREESVTLGRPAEAVALPELLRIGYGMGGEATGVASELREQAIRALDGRTLAGVLATAPGGDHAGAALPGPARGEAAQSGGTE